MGAVVDGVGAEAEDEAAEVVAVEEEDLVVVVAAAGVSRDRLGVEEEVVVVAARLGRRVEVAHVLLVAAPRVPRVVVAAVHHVHQEEEEEALQSHLVLAGALHVHPEARHRSHRKSPPEGACHPQASGRLVVVTVRRQVEALRSYPLEIVPMEVIVRHREARILDLEQVRPIDLEQARRIDLDNVREVRTLGLEQAHPIDPGRGPGHPAGA